ncbi:hypothetical protein H6P81_010607 [Aristolochia fimbriata]|uniref:Uncharacterized protein n=1 Tax=Aristolochia fimbriata TaxID=158543 RepID=A0AAV7ESM8_ARIFI|nr:hypothetical protein H6P81_010607 [Aristolochia fimbriata]
MEELKARYLRKYPQAAEDEAMNYCLETAKQQLSKQISHAFKVPAMTPQQRRFAELALAKRYERRYWDRYYRHQIHVMTQELRHLHPPSAARVEEAEIIMTQNQGEWRHHDYARRRFLVVKSILQWTRLYVQAQ